VPQILRVAEQGDGWGSRSTNTVIRQKQVEPWKSARILALVNFAVADASIASFDAKYHFRFWRPSTAIHRGDEDGNPLTEQDAGWQPLFSTPPLVSPPIPDYPSNHAVVGAAAAEGRLRRVREGAEPWRWDLLLVGTADAQAVSTRLRGDPVSGCSSCLQPHDQ
jgi:hypothetical protein